MDKRVSLLPCFHYFARSPASESWLSITLLSQFSFRAHTYIYNVCPSVSAHTSFQKYVLQHPYQSTSYKLVSKNLWKNDRYIWSEWIYPLLLHPLSKRRKALKLTFWQKRILNSSKFLFFCAYSNQEWRCWKEIWKKNFRNIWKLSDKVLTFAPAFVEKQFKNWLADRNGAKNVFFFFYLPFDKRDDEKKKKEKKLPKIFGVYT